MRRLYVLTGTVVVVCLSLAFANHYLFAAAIHVRVNERATILKLEDERTAVALALENLTGQPLSARIEIELLDTQNRAFSRIERVEELPAGPSVRQFGLAASWNQMSASSRREFIWYRLRYRVTPQLPEPATPSEGFISLSEITPELFTLQVTAPEYLSAGSTTRVQVRALHPATAKPIRDVKLTGVFSFDDERANPPLKAVGLTDAEGYARLEFSLPAKIRDEEASLKLTGQRGDFTQEAEEDIRFNRLVQIMLQTDKPLYQPGQTLHVRALVFGDNQRVLPATEINCRIKDPEDDEVFRTTLTTSEYGIASFDWPIPSNMRLGNFRIEAATADEEYSLSGRTFKISRYELPNFAVSAKPDRSYYLPGQAATVEIRADYLFGQPVTRGHVRLVREEERKWNYHEQKWEIEEADTYEGKLDEAGRFSVPVNLADAHEDLQEHNYERFDDLHYTAYVTDATSGRTEQRQFDVRITKAAIHIYAIHEWGDQAADFPLEFFVTANYADGSPAVCDIAISDVQEITGFKLEEETRVTFLQTVRTNRYGLAKVSGLRVPPREDEREQVSLRFNARDAQQLSGESTETFYLSSDPIVRVTADKTLLRPGEAIEATITASDPNLAVTVDLVQNLSPVQSQFVQLRNGQARVRFAYQPNFKGLLTVAAYAPFAEHDFHPDPGKHTVLYPHNQELQLDVQMSRTSYQPGAEAQAELRVRNATGQPITSALGLVVYDKALDERARTDAGFDRQHSSKGFALDERDNETIGGINLRQLNQLDLKQSISAELELAAQVLLRNRSYRPKCFNSDGIERDLSELYRNVVYPQITAVETALDQHYEKRGVYPTDENELRRTLALYEVVLAELPDPWGQTYRPVFSVQGQTDVLELFSAGADKQFETADDFRVLRKARFYFTHYGAAINRAVEQYHARTGGYVRDLATLQRELTQAGFEPERWRDPWGQPYLYQFGIEKRNYTINVLSSGPDGRADTADGFVVWTARIDWFAPQRFALNQALNHYFQTKQSFPQNEAEWRAALQAAGIDWEQVRDAWGQSLLLKFSNRTSLAGTVNVRRYTPNRTAAPTGQQPVTQNNIFIALQSIGADGKPDTADDFEVTNFLRSFIETTLEWQAQTRNQPSTGLKGAIAGVVTDASGAVIPNVTVKATQNTNKQVYQGRTNSEGYYLTDKLPVGLYDLRFEATGFQISLVTGVPVYASNLTRVDATLQVGTTSETVTVTADAPMLLQTESASVTTTKTENRLVQVIPPSQTGTPRLREYFPETLLWQPQLVTDRNGRAQLNFKLADNITTWKLAVVASTLDGKLGTVEHEFRAFQPFFLEHEPPPVLTEGDEITLPVLVRNYTEQPQNVTVEMKAADWFTLLGPARQAVPAAINEAARALFSIRATASIEQGKQRVLAFANTTNDALEKPITVHPDGEEVAQTAAQVFAERAELELTIPDAAFKNSLRGELKIYPNLRAHVLESLEGILRRPYGCGEQTISSTYPNLLALRYYQLHGGEFAPAANKAKRFLQEGYERLLTYHAEGSGFGYWSGNKPDQALTAYALRFLQDARDFIKVDETVIRDAALWLLEESNWQTGTVDATPARAATAAYLAYSLAAVVKDNAIDSALDKAQRAKLAMGVGTLLKTLTPLTPTSKDAYLLACYALAAAELGETEKAGQALARLRTLAQTEAGANYWEPSDHTPFHGWGLTGRLETTALVVQSLARQPERNSADQQLLNRGLAFLLRHKDRYGVWHSTQATINVLKTLIVVDEDRNVTANAGGTAEIFVNGQRAATLKLPPSSKLTNPLSIDLSRYLTIGKQRVEIRQLGQTNPASAQFVTTHYQPWQTRSLAEQSLKLNVQFDKTTVEPNETVTCNVAVARLKGSGMVIAEIGLPPGAQVERGSLEQAIRERGYTIDRYDVLPDRVIFYLWPGYGSGTTLSFQFRPRLALKAQSAPSLAYDYYNPEARAVVPPVYFVVR